MGSACAFPLFVLLPGGRHSARTRRDSQPLGVQGMVQFRPTYSQYIPSCLEEQTPTGCLLSGQLGLSQQAAKSWPSELVWICQDWVNLHGIQLPQLLQGSRAACRLVHELLERGRLSCA